MRQTEAERLFEQLIEAVAHEEVLRSLYRDLCLAAVRYARARTDWQLADTQTRIAMDATRTASHNALIDACNILSRACATLGRSTEWRRNLGEDRRQIGDFACHLHACLGVLAR